MTPERWQHIESLVEAALEAKAEDRTDFLDTACGNDPELRRNVEALLQSLDEVDSFMETPAVQAFDSETPAATENLARLSMELGEGDQIGHYRILHEIGRGGMGTVYAAARDDQEYQHQVAIKLIPPGMYSAIVAQRFRSERQILANLDHPNIARLLDGGTTGDGHPYVVMELIEGLRIDRYCDRERLPIDHRLELFREVCAAVDYAHRNLVVHRDIKPSNILVTGGGVPKLLDFGIAKLLDSADFAHTVEITRTGLRPMTPPYASPEQILGKPITTTSDVYSLGLLLYKLLTGRLPHSLEGASTREMQRALLAGRVPPPSSAITLPRDAGELSPETIGQQRGTQPLQLRRRLVGDLDNIVLMALRQEPERRYGSVEQLSEDLRRHLAGLPVSARRDTFGYRAGKFLRRNKLAASIAGASAALVLGFAATMATQAVQLARQRDRARRERDNAERERHKAEKVSAFLTDLFGLVDPDGAGGSTITARELLDQGVDKIQHELADEPEIQAALMCAVGKIYRKLGLFRHAGPLLTQALAQREAMLGPDHADVGDTLMELGLLYRHQGLHDQARDVFRRALDLRTGALGPSHPDVAEIMIYLADNDFWGGDGEAAMIWIDDGLRILEATRNASGWLAAQALGIRAIVHLENGENERARELQQRSLELLERDPKPHTIEIAIAIANLGVISSNAGDYHRAKPIFERAIEKFKLALGEKHPEVAVCMANIGVCHSVQGEFERAEHLLRKALDIFERTIGDEHRSVASIKNKIAMLARRQGELERAERFFLEAMETYQKLTMTPKINAAYNLCKLADLYRESARLEQADSLYQQAIAIQRRLPGPSHLNLAESLCGLAGTRARQGRHDVAEELYDESLAITEQLASRHHGDRKIQAQLALVHLERGELYRSTGRERSARGAWRQAIAAGEHLASHTDIVDSLDVHARALLRLGRIDDARPIVERLLAIGWSAADFLHLCQRHELVPDPGGSAPCR